MEAQNTPVASPYLSVVIPVLNGSETLGACLDSLRGSTFADWELIVVDDGSTDDSAAIAARAGSTLLQTKGRQGPGAARNQGASQANGENLLFVDADCSVAPDALERVAEILLLEPEIDAVFGSYDDAPSAPGVVARYKNLQHHFVHQQAGSEATTFWAGCGAIRRAAFASLGGFDTQKYERPAIEDIELGYRLRDAGGRIRLAKDVQVKHHKAWTFTAVLRSDLLDRGIPWTLLLLERADVGRDLNLGLEGRLSVVLALVLLFGLVVSVFSSAALLLSLGAGLGLLWLNAGFYRLLARQGGVTLALGGIGLHWLYQLNCAAAYLIGRFRFWRRGGEASSSSA